MYNLYAVGYVYIYTYSSQYREAGWAKEPSKEILLRTSGPYPGFTITLRHTTLGRTPLDE